MTTNEVTVLITDMEGSTAFTAEEGDRTAVELMRVHERLVRQTLGVHEGREIKSMGDGFMLMFPSPASGVMCALDLLDALAQHNEMRPDQPLNVRMGINSGPVIEEKGDIYGTTVNAASRVAAKARSGQVLVSQGVRDAAAEDVDCNFVDRGLFWLKGLREQWRLFEATHASSAPYRPAIAEGRTPFVDRDLERVQLRSLVDAAMEGHGSIVLLAGDQGTGKSRLADEIGNEAQGRGMRYLLGRCYEVAQNQPYTPLIETFESLERRLEPAAFRATLGEAAGEIARLLPDIRRRFPEIPPTADLPADQERRFLFASTRAVLASLAAVRPLFLVWDDIHWADEPTLAFLEHLATDISDLPILIVATYQYGEVSPVRPLRATLEALHRRRLVEQIEIGPLSRDDIHALLTSITDVEPPPELSDVLFRDTEGNAFFFEEVVRHLSDRGLLFDDAGAWRGDLGDTHLDVPESLRLVLRRRLEALSEDAQKVLMRAALIGRGFGWDLFETLANTDEDTLLDALDEAEHTRLIASATERGVVRFTFSHELIRQTIVDDVSPARSQRLHLDIADAMERVYSGSLPEHAEAIAAHLERAGHRDADRSVHFLLLAGERAIEVAAYADAQRLLERALALLPDNDFSKRGLVLERLGTASRSLGRPDDAIAIWTRALDAYEAAGNLDAVARLCLDAGVQVAAWIRGQSTTALVERGLKALGDRITAVRAGLIALSAGIASQSATYERATELFDEALPIARAEGDARVLGMVLYGRAAHHFSYNEFDQTIAYGTESIDHLRAGGDLWNLANVLGYVGNAYSWLGRFEEGAQFGAEGEPLATRLTNWPALIFAERAQFQAWFGKAPDLEYYEKDGKRALELGQTQGFRWLQALGWTRMGLAAFWCGRWDEALRNFEEAARVEPAGATGGHSGGLILTKAYAGDHTDALELLEKARPQFTTPGSHHSMTGEALTLVAIEAFALLGRDADAAELYPVAAEVVRGGMIARVWDYRLLETVAGVGATCAGDLEAAEQHFENGLRRIAELPLRLEEGDACRFYAWMLLRRDAGGDNEKARVLIDRAVAAYRRVGMPRHEALATELLAQRA